MNSKLTENERNSVIEAAGKKVAEQAVIKGNDQSTSELTRTTITIPKDVMNEITMITTKNKIKRQGPPTISALIRSLLESYLEAQYQSDQASKAIDTYTENQQAKTK